MKDNIAIEIDNISKSFRLYYDKPMTIKDRALKRVKSSYKNFLAIDNVTLDIKKGEQIGLIGHNGCGKSTLLKLVCGILTPDKGKIFVDGKISSLLELGAGFHPDFSGRENIYTNAAIFGMSHLQTEKLVEPIIEFSELGEFIDNPVRTYSSGMYMRLAFSVAIHVKPEILLIDEILAVGDAAFQKKCFDRIMKFKTQGVTIIIVSHDLETIKKICDRVIWIDKGIIRGDGEPSYIIDMYLSELFGNKSQETLVPINETQYILDTKICDINGNDKNTFNKEYIAIECNLSDTFSFYKHGLEIKIYNQNNVLVFKADNLENKKDLKLSQKISLIIESNNIVNDKYTVDVLCLDKNHNIIEEKKNACNFEIVSENEADGAISLPHRWKYEEN